MIEKIKLELIRKKFLSCSKISNFDFPETFEIIEQKELYDATVDDPLVLKYPVKYRYQLNFVKELMEVLKENDEEVYELFYEKLIDLLSRSESKGLTHYRHFLMGDRGKIDRLIIEESQSVISEGTTGLCSWQGASALAEWCVENRDQLKNKKILELGSGVGLTGLTILNFCSPQKFTFSDCHPRVLNLLRSNIDRNFSNLKDEFDVLDLSWEEVDDKLREDLSPDLVIAADVVYDNSLFAALINALRIFLNKDNRFGIIAMTIRNEETVSEFFKHLDVEGFNYEELELPTFSVFFRTDETPIRIVKLFHNRNC